MTRRELIKAKAGVLCLGLKPNRVAEEIYLIQHPTTHKRTGNAGLHVVLEGGLVLNAIYGERFCEGSPFHLEKQEGQYWLFNNETPVCQLSVIEPPKWYTQRTADGVYFSDVILLEGLDTLISGVWNNCCYFRNGTQCKFCILGFERGLEWKSVDHLTQAIEAALKENPNYRVHLTGGNTFTPDHGISYYQKYVKAVREVGGRIITLELSPPEDMGYLDNIVGVGVGGFSFNIEVWDEDKRREICPGKSKIRRELYFKAWERGVELLGRFRVSSAIIVGLDRPESVAEGIKQMVNLGVKPAMLPFRPFGKGALGNLPPADPKEFLDLTELAGRELKKAGAKFEDFVGCEHCGACGTEADFLNL